MSTPILVPESSTAVRHEIEIRRSRFISLIHRADSVAEARSIVDAERALYPDARHHCLAFALASANTAPLLHSSDDGEPSGTAGRPMLDVLAGVPLFNVVAIVTRYFGGTLLGTGGLVRAYSQSVRECLEGVQLNQLLTLATWSLTLPHGEAGRYFAEFSNRGWDYTADYLPDGVHVHIATDDDVATRVRALSAGSLSANPAGAEVRERPWGSVRDGHAVATVRP